MPWIVAVEMLTCVSLVVFTGENRARDAESWEMCQQMKFR